MKKDDNGSISRGKFLAAVPVLRRSYRCCDAASPGRKRNRRLGSGDERGKPIRGQVLELGGVLTAKFLTQLTGRCSPATRASSRSASSGWFSLQ